MKLLLTYLIFLFALMPATKPPATEPKTGFLIVLQTDSPRRSFVNKTTDAHLVDNTIKKHFHSSGFCCDTVMNESCFFEIRKENITLYVEKGTLVQKRNGKLKFKKLKKN